MKYPFWLTILVAGLLLAGGCSSQKAFQEPTIQITSVRLTDQTDQGARVEITLQLENHNDIALPLLHADYSVTVADKTFAFDDPSERTLPANGQQTLVIPAAFASPGRALAGQGYSVLGSVTYRPPGRLRQLLTEFDIPLPWVDFERTGKLD